MKTPRGIEVREGKKGKTLRIEFVYRGVRCREKVNLDVTNQSIKYAANLRAEIVRKIALGTFSYADYFPESKRCILFGETRSKLTLDQCAESYFKEIQNTLEHSTIFIYRKSYERYGKRYFGQMRMTDITALQLKEFILELDKSRKTVLNALTPLRNIFANATHDGLIDANPFDKIKLDRLLTKNQKQKTEIDPFTTEEINLLLSKSKGQLKNLIQFSLFTGCRPSESFALTWKDCIADFTKVNINKAIVLRLTKDPKTKASNRTITLLQPAKDAIISQRKHSALHSENVFLCPSSNKPWLDSDQLRRHWLRLLSDAKVRHRPFYQCRHTFASQMLSNGENLLWVASVMGHTDAQTTLKKYARFVSDKAKSYEPKNVWSV